MKIIGFDPSSKRNLGWCIISLEPEGEMSCVAGRVVLPNCQDVSEVQWPLFISVDTILQETEPDVLVIEKTSQFAGGFITGQVSNCMGTIFAAAGKNQMQVKYVSPTHVKKIISGNGRAKKGLMKKSVKDMLESLGLTDIKFDSEHAYDAVASVLCWLIDNQFLENKNGP